MKAQMSLIIIAGLFFAFQIGRIFSQHSPLAQTAADCCTFLPSDAGCQMCDAILSGQYQPKYDYQIDIFDRGDGTVILQDIKTGEIWVVPFEELEETIMKLNL